jgi:hypothetical protein
MSIHSGRLSGINYDDLRNVRFLFETQTQQHVADSYDHRRSMLLKYKELYGDMLVPQIFVIPNDNNWPEEMWGCKLGRLVQNIRYGYAHKDQRDDLISIGFVFDDTRKIHADAAYDLTRRMLLRYKELYGNMLVPQKYVVPSNDDNWPDEEMWGYKLGRAVSRIRYGRQHAEKRGDLKSIGFTFERLRTTNPVDIYEFKRRMLLRYKEIYGNLCVPARFIIPSDDDDWPEEMWGFKLGTAVCHMKYGYSHVDKYDDLLSIGFIFEKQQPDTPCNFDYKRRALLKYKELYGDMLVPYNFIVPSSDKDKNNWPEDMRGFKLGEAVKQIKCHRVHEDKREELISIGFSFDIKKIGSSYEFKRCMLLKYKELHGHMRVPRKFVVPSNNNKWPQDMWGYKLGNAVRSMRCGETHRDRQEDLESIGFEFDRSKYPVLPEKPIEVRQQPQQQKEQQQQRMLQLPPQKRQKLQPDGQLQHSQQDTQEYQQQQNHQHQQHQHHYQTRQSQLRPLSPLMFPLSEDVYAQSDSFLPSPIPLSPPPPR